jgi:L-cysteine/cystine lyase
VIDLERVRTDMPATAASAYLNAGTFGPVPAPSAEAQLAEIRHGLESGRIGSSAYVAWRELTDRARAAFAVAAGATPDEIALTHSTTDGCNTAIWGLEWSAGDEVVTTTHEHPGITAPLEELVRRRGAVVRAVEPVRGAIEGAITERTRLVALSHVLWTTGAVLPLPEIAEAAHAAGALLLVDGAQSGGAIPIDPAGSGADFYTLSGQKWLLGPSGTGALWVRPASLGRLATPAPWYLSRNRMVSPPEDWPSARRLDMPCTLSALAGAAAAIEWRTEVGWEPAWARSAALAGVLRGRLRDVPGVSLEAVETPSTIVAFRVHGREPADVTAACEEAGVLIRHIPTHGLVRVSVGFWNNEEDLERLLAVVGGA